jgi:hypothetical protein
MTEAQIKKEMSVHQLEHVETIGVLPWQHIVDLPETGQDCGARRELRSGAQPCGAAAFGRVEMSAQKFTWRKLSNAKWEDVWPER